MNSSVFNDFLNKAKPCSGGRCASSVAYDTPAAQISVRLQEVQFPPSMGSAEYCDERVCLRARVCLSTIISPELHVRSSPFSCVLSMAVARSSSGGVVICYVFPVMWMTSNLNIS